METQNLEQVAAALPQTKRRGRPPVNAIVAAVTDGAAVSAPSQPLVQASGGTPKVKQIRKARTASAGGKRASGTAGITSLSQGTATGGNAIMTTKALNYLSRLGSMIGQAPQHGITVPELRTYTAGFFTV